MSFNWRKDVAVVATLAGSLLFVPQALAAIQPFHTAHATSHASGGGTTSLTQATYAVNENVGHFPITVQRTTDLSKPETFYYGVTFKGSQAGQNFDKIGNTQAVIPAGQSSATFDITVHNQDINGPKRYARAYIYGPSMGTLGEPNQAIVQLLQNDPLQAKNPENPLGYAQTPTDGDPLQFVKWYVFGNTVAPGQFAGHYASSNPAWAQALHTIAYTPGSWSYRFWMWNEPTATLAATVEKYLADAEHAQPNTTVALSTYSLVHGACESPSAIKGHFENWITQLAHGIGNFRVVLYLEEDSLIETSCLKHAQLQTRLEELAYAVKTLSADPHLLIYMDAGAPDAGHPASRIADELKQADIAQANGFYVNATHKDWTTADVNYGQQIARLTGGKHFIVQTDDNGRGPLVPKDRVDHGNEILCNPPGRGAGPLTWDTGYEYVDGFLWFNNPGNSDGTCGAGDPSTGTFWPSYAIGLIQHATDSVTGPHYHLLKSTTNQ
jgi:endoglucanase